MPRNRRQNAVRMPPQRAPPPIPVPESNTRSPPHTIYGVMTEEQYAKYMDQVKKYRSRTRPIFINHLNVPVTVYWFRSSEPDKLYTCCEVLSKKDGGYEGPSKITQYMYGTRLKLVWKDSHGNTMHTFTKIMKENQTIHIERDQSLQWKHSAIKMNYLLKQMVRLGGTNETLYPNLAPLLELVNDIEIPDITENDKQNAGIPSVYDIE